MPTLLRVGGRVLRTLPRVAVVVAGAGFALRPTRLVVTGASMEPTLRPGDRLLVIRWPRVRPGMLVAVRDPRLPSRLIVKRVARVEGRAVTVLGDNPDASTDGRHFGPVDTRLVRGRAVYRYAPPDRVGSMLGPRTSAGPAPVLSER